MSLDWHGHHPARCPYCGKANDEVAELLGQRDDPPENGDISLCFSCGQFAIFDDHDPNRVRLPSNLEGLQIAASKQCRAMAEAWYRQRKAAPAWRRR